MIIREATIDDLPYVLDLAKKEGKALGFIPRMAYEASITGVNKGKAWSDTCNDKLWICEENKDPVGFLKMSFGKWARVNQIAIQDDARLIERGKALLKVGMDWGQQRGRDDFVCGCANDLESNAFWKAMRWKYIGERKGKYYKNTWLEVSKRPINVYHFQKNSLFYEE